MLTDLTYLKSMSNNDNNFIKEMVDIFREQVGEYSSEFPELIANEEYDSLSKLAHKAKTAKQALLPICREVKARTIVLTPLLPPNTGLIALLLITRFKL